MPIVSANCPSFSLTASASHSANVSVPAGRERLTPAVGEFDADRCKESVRARQRPVTTVGLVGGGGIDECPTTRTTTAP